LNWIKACEQARIYPQELLTGFPLRPHRHLRHRRPIPVRIAAVPEAHAVFARRYAKFPLVAVMCPPVVVRAAGSKAPMEYTCAAATVPETVNTYEVGVLLTRAVMVRLLVPKSQVAGKLSGLMMMTTDK